MRTDRPTRRPGRWGILLLPALLVAASVSRAAEQAAPRILVLGSKSPAANPEGIASQLKTVLAADEDLGQTDAAWRDTTVGHGVTLMNFYYHPEGRDDRLAVLRKGWTHVVLVDAPRSLYAPEFHFEGVRTIREALKGSPTRPLLLMHYAEKPEDLKRCGEIAYRVGTGCGVDVIPAGQARAKAVRDGLAGDADADLLAALCIYSRVTGRSAAGLFDRKADPADKKRKSLAACAWTVLEAEKKREPVQGPYRGVVRVTRQEKKAVRFMNIGTSSENIWKGSLSHLLKNRGITSQVSSTPRSRGGFQMSVFPKVRSFLEADAYDILFARHYYLEPDKLRELRALPGAKNAQFQVYDRHWDMAKSPREEKKGVMLFVKNLEPALFRIYIHARKNDLVHIPFHLAVARMSVVHPDAPFTRDGTHWTPWYGYMVANMSFTALTGQSGEMDPAFWLKQCKGNRQEADYMFAGARIGHEVMVQLASLSVK